MIEWNVVVTVHDEGFDEAEQVLGGLGELARTGFHNVLVLRVKDTGEFVERLGTLCQMNPDLLEHVISRAIPAEDTFEFHSAEEFREKASDVVGRRAPELDGCSFHVRMERRGFGSRLGSQREERRLGQEVFDALEEQDGSAEVTFEDPDAVLLVETVSDRAGISLFTREQLRRHRFLAG